MSKLKSKKATKEQKKSAHEIFDITWENIFLPESEKQSLRSLVYQLFAAVLLKQESFFTTEGIIDPRKGGQHISRLPLAYHNDLKNFIKYIVFDQNKGNTTKLSHWLVRWSNKVQAVISKTSKEKLNEELIHYMGSDEVVTSIRDKLGFRKLPKLKEVEEVVEDIESQSEVELEESGPEKVSDQKEKQAKKKLISVKDVFIDALYAEVCGDDRRAIELCEQAEKMGYEDEAKKQNISEDERQLQNNLKSSFYSRAINYYVSNNKEAKARELTKRMAQAKIPQALYNLAFNYEKSGRKLEVSALLKEAADLGHDLSQYIIGSRYLNLGTEEGFKEGFKYSSMAAEQGHAGAHCNLGKCYVHGHGAEKDDERAVEHFHAATEIGHINAAKLLVSFSHNLAMDYLHGENGKTHDFSKAAKYFSYGVKYNSPSSCYNLAACYLQGDGVERDVRKAYNLAKAAADMDFDVAIKNMGIFTEALKKVQEQKKSQPSDSIQTAEEFNGVVNKLHKMLAIVKAGDQKSIEAMTRSYLKCNDYYVKADKDSIKEVISKKLDEIRGSPLLKPSSVAMQISGLLVASPTLKSQQAK